MSCELTSSCCLSDRQIRFRHRYFVKKGLVSSITVCEQIKIHNLSLSSLNEPIVDIDIDIVFDDTEDFLLFEDGSHVALEDTYELVYETG